MSGPILAGDCVTQRRWGVTTLYVTVGAEMPEGWLGGRRVRAWKVAPRNDPYTDIMLRFKSGAVSWMPIQCFYGRQASVLMDFLWGRPRMRVFTDRQAAYAHMSSHPDFTLDRALESIARRFPDNLPVAVILLLVRLLVPRPLRRDYWFFQ